jgi:hypothetical protein
MRRRTQVSDSAKSNHHLCRDAVLLCDIFNHVNLRVDDRNFELLRGVMVR